MKGWIDRFDEEFVRLDASVIRDNGSMEISGRQIVWTDNPEMIKAFIAREIKQARMDMYKEVYSKPPFSCDNCQIILCGEHM